MKNKSGKVENRRPLYVSPEIEGKPRFKPGTFTKVMSIYLSAVCVPLLALVILQGQGYYLLNRSVLYYLLAAAIAGVLVWMVVGARKFMRRPALKRTMTVSLSVIAVLVMAYTLSIVSAYNTYLPVETGRAISPGGTNRLVILRSYYIDLERMEEEARKEYPDLSDDEIIDLVMAGLQTSQAADVFSYVYMAYPIRAGIFYYTKVEVGSTLLIVARDSQADLHVRWEDEDSATLYANNPGPYDRGEFTLKCR